MTNEQVIYALIGVLGVLFALFIGLLSWIGVRLHSKQDELFVLVNSKFTETTNKLGEIEKSLVDRIFSLDRRLTRVEAESVVDKMHTKGKAA